MIYAVHQQSPEWLSIRCGKATASRVKDIMDFTAKGLPTAKHTNYLYEVVAERMTGLTTEHFVTNAMIWGSETEELAREVYEIHTGNTAVQVGIATHPRIEMFAASPDGIVNGDGLLELKCPMPSTHIKWIQGQVIPEEHLWQCHAEMACWDLDYVDFMSFDPRPRARYQRFIRRLERDHAKEAEMEAGVLKFLGMVDAIMQQLDILCPENGDALPSKERNTRTQASPIDTTDMPAWMRPKTSPLPRTGAGDVDLGKLADQLDGDISQ